jgi:WYL_2, Sm-like SH3 beta-barrel fold
MPLSETDLNKFKKWLSVLLKNNTVTITFTKKDGNERVMKCTADPTVILFKDPNSLSSTGAKKPNQDVFSVYDLENSGWRSFRWDSIKQVRFTL